MLHKKLIVDQVQNGEAVRAHASVKNPKPRGLYNAARRASAAIFPLSSSPPGAAGRSERPPFFLLTFEEICARLVG
jgi:hypothetical protein